MAGASLKVRQGVRSRDAAPDLQAAGVGAQRAFGYFLVTGPEHDYMPAIDIVTCVHAASLRRARSSLR